MQVKSFGLAILTVITIGLVLRFGGNANGILKTLSGGATDDLNVLALTSAPGNNV